MGLFSRLFKKLYNLIFTNDMYSLIVSGYGNDGAENFRINNVDREYCNKILNGIHDQYKFNTECKDIPFKHDPEIGLYVSVIKSNGLNYHENHFIINSSGIKGLDI